ncbi:MAG: RDD family protein [Thermoplasmata archaeon]|nr:RDD family protein [Thermoplasmata archaeon]
MVPPMVDLGQLANDVAANVAFLLLPTGLWLFLYLWIWERPQEAAAAGFDRRTFWLLVAGGIAGTLADIPILWWTGDVLAVNIGGGLLPIAISLWLIYRSLPGPGLATLQRFLLLFGATTAALFAVVVLAPAAWLPWLVTGGAALVAAAAFVSVDSTSPWRGVALLTGLSLLGLDLAFLTSVTVPSAGIESMFPLYLIAPLLLGAIPAVVAPRYLGTARIVSVPIAFASMTFGVLTGADVLHQPPLYGKGAGILAIGGAGVQDLVYLSGLFAVVVAWTATWAIERRQRGTADPVPSKPALSGEPIALAVRHVQEGRTELAIAASQAAVRSAVEEARRLRALPVSGAGEDPWSGLPVPGWARTDAANLEAFGRVPPRSSRDGIRALLTARELVTVARQVTQPVFATVRARTTAFLLDLAIVTAPALAVFAIIVWTATGGPLVLLNNIPLVTATLAYPALAYLYFALFETFTGTTPGKRILGLVVVDRALQRPGPSTALVRNTPLILPLAAIALVLADLLLFVRFHTTSAPGDLSVVNVGLSNALLAGSIICALTGAATLLALAITGGRGRVGDVWAGTRVLRRSWIIPAGGSPAPRPARAQSATSGS